MKKIINLVLSNFSLFLLFLAVFFLQNRVLIFKVANNFKVSEVDVRAFMYYQKHNKIEGFKFKSNENLKKEGLLKFANVKKPISVFNKDEFLKKIDNYKKTLNFVYKMLGIATLLLLYKFIKNVRI